MFTMIYYLLQTVSTAIISTVVTIWMIEEALIKLMMSSFLYALRIACHPLMVIPMLVGLYYLVNKMWPRPSMLADASEKFGMRRQVRTPRIGSYRSIGSISVRSNDSFDLDVDEVCQRN
ncbi:uncharacterized protein LOC6559442 [Drosophila grimshawi]|uniref:GH21175 n=1 Tax=Drosophila grimshawi TaxID=7222 RepID=B4J6Q9_DROGR|nr:uncharacterized protein LOC6559442 [Drosophila grimshawi]EDW00962.1 GH21175 [Drosophila grimshawi]